MKWLGAASLLACLGAALPAGAVEISIGGNYGNEAGCKYLATNNYEGEDLVALTPKQVQTYVTLCSFVNATTLENGTIVTTVICGHEGEGYETLGLMRFAKVYEQDKWGIYDGDGTSWGEVPRCP
jgi:hypothetical protein